MSFRSASLICLVLSVLATPPIVTVQDDAEPGKTAAKKDPMGYFLGVSVGQRMAEQGFTADDFDSRSHGRRRGRWLGRPRAGTFR